MEFSVPLSLVHLSVKRGLAFFSIESHVVIVLLNQPISSHQLLQFFVGNVNLVGFIINGDKSDIRFGCFHKDNVGNYSCSATFSFDFGSDRETNFAQMFTERCSHLWCFTQRFKKSTIILLHRRIVLGQLL